MVLKILKKIFIKRKLGRVMLILNKIYFKIKKVIRRIWSYYNMICFNKVRVDYNLKFLYIKLKSFKVFEKILRRNWKI